MIRLLFTLLVVFAPVARTEAGDTPPGHRAFFDDPRKPLLDAKNRLIRYHDPSALRRLYSLAEKGDTEARTILGYAYDHGIAPAAANSRLAGQLWLAAARQGDPIALHNLGVLYWQGRGVARSLPLAEKLFALSGSRGVIRSKAILGQLAEARHDYAAALAHYKDCLPYRTLPNAKSRYSILLMRTGDMTSANHREEVYTQLRAAADRWDIDAQYTLARLHAEGVVIRHSLPDAVFWLEVLRRNPAAKPYWSSRDAFIRAYRIGETDIQTGKEMARMWLGDDPAFTPAVDYTRSILEKDPVF